MSLSPLIADLVSALQVLPGVGPKGAQRMALHMLQRNREGGAKLAESLSAACEHVGYCDQCKTLSENPICAICADDRRNAAMLCVVESPADILAIEAAGGFSGRYFVLHGHLSPIDGIGPIELGLPDLEALLRRHPLEELILATNPTVEGEATAHYISQLADGVVAQISRIAHGVPVGGELEFVDGGTIVHALTGRRKLGPMTLVRPLLEREYLGSNEDLLAAADSWQGPIAFDTEFIRTRTFFPIPGLYQLATDRYSYLIDPVTIEAWAPLIARLDAATPIVMHSCSEDLELLNHHVSVQPGALFDTQVAYGFITEKYSASYAALVADYAGLELDKGATRSNWLKRPLTDAQVGYAHEDVTWLLQIRERMLEQLEQLGRLEWCEQEMRLATTYKTLDPLEYYLNLGSAWRLRREQLGALRQLCSWREQQARAEDVPRNKIVGDDVLLTLAHEHQLNNAVLRDNLSPQLQRRYADDLIDAHQRGLDDTNFLAPIQKPLSSSENKLVKELREVAKVRAEGLGMAPELLARKREVEKLVRGLRDTRESLHNYSDWRAELVGDDFRRLLARPTASGNSAAGNSAAGNSAPANNDVSR